MKEKKEVRMVRGAYKRRLKKLLLEAPALRKADYAEGKLIYVTVDMSPTGIGWVIHQEGEDGVQYAILFGAKVLNNNSKDKPKSSGNFGVLRLL